MTGQISGKQPLLAGGIQFDHHPRGPVWNLLTHDRIYQGEIVRVRLAGDPDVAAAVNGRGLWNIVAAAAWRRLRVQPRSCQYHMRALDPGTVETKHSRRAIRAN